jgi:hypothetical protein
MFDFLTFWLIVLAVLIVYLGVSLGVHAYIQEVRQRPQERQFEGHGFQVSTIASRVEQVRQDHLGFTQNKPKNSSYRTELMASARRMLIGMSFFQRKRSEDDMEKQES